MIVGIQNQVLISFVTALMCDKILMVRNESRNFIKVNLKKKNTLRKYIFIKFGRFSTKIERG